MSFNPRDYTRTALDALTVLMETDAYKLDHRRQYPDRTEVVYSNLTARGSRVAGVDWTVFFGLQAYLADLAVRWQAFFDADIDGGVPGVRGAGHRHSGTERRWLRTHPAAARLRPAAAAVPGAAGGDGHPAGDPYLTVENTEPRFFWLTNYIETDLSAALWQPITSATTAWRNRCLLDERAEASGADPAAVNWQGHDFSARGSGRYGCGVGQRCRAPVEFHRNRLAVIAGLDRPVLPRIAGGAVLGGSVPATEHSVMTANGPEGSWPRSSGCWICTRRGSFRWSATAGIYGR